eukprot:g15527.t1
MVRQKVSLLFLWAIAPFALGNDDGNISKSVQEASHKAVAAPAEGDSLFGRMRRNLLLFGKGDSSSDSSDNNDFGDIGGSVCINNIPDGLTDILSEIPGVPSLDGLACCSPECETCGLCGDRRLILDSFDDKCRGRRRLTMKGGESSRELTGNFCGVRRRRNLLFFGGSSDSSSSDDSSDDFCDCSSGRNDDRRLRGLLLFGGKDSSDDSCDCGRGRRLFLKGDSSSSDDCDCECECECECAPEPSCCEEDIIEFGELCNVIGIAPCSFDTETTPEPTPDVVCGSYTCSAGLEPILDRIPNACFQNVCNDEQCCQTPVDVPDAVCPGADNIPGVESSNGDVCCVASCGICGGPGCSSRGPAEDCCESTIEDFGEPCSSTGAAPCYIGDVPAPGPVCPSVNIPGIESSSGEACCLSSCGQCGGEDCATAGSPSDCCEEDIVEFGDPCSETNEAPCFIGDVCPSANNIRGIEDSERRACCVDSCGLCGGADCDSAGPASECCVTDIEDFGAPCTETNAAPCFIGDIPDPVCPGADNIPGVESSNGDVCCVASCGICGGPGCSSRGPAEDCCESTIEDSGEPCSSTGAAPCYIGDAPEPEPVVCGSYTCGAGLEPIADRIPNACFQNVCNDEQCCQTPGAVVPEPTPDDSSDLIPGIPSDIPDIPFGGSDDCDSSDSSDDCSSDSDSRDGIIGLLP